MQLDKGLRYVESRIKKGLLNYSSSALILRVLETDSY